MQFILLSIHLALLIGPSPNSHPHSVEVGGGRLVDAAHMLAGQPTLWALLVGIAINIARVGFQAGGEPQRLRMGGQGAGQL